MKRRALVRFAVGEVQEGLHPVADGREAPARIDGRRRDVPDDALAVGDVHVVLGPAQLARAVGHVEGGLAEDAVELEQVGLLFAQLDDPLHGPPVVDD